MNREDAIIRLLTEILDNQREEAERRAKIIEESLRLQRLTVRRQSIGIVIGVFMIVAGIIAIALYFFK
jgi:hypothetical protein